MPNLQVKKVPDEVYAELRRRAQLRGTTLRDYVLRLIRDDQLLPTREEWFARLEALRPIAMPEAAHEAIARDRREREEELDRR